MKRIVFGRRQKVYLPEIPAYIKYINNHVEGWQAFDSQEFEDYNPRDFDVVWRFMGFDLKGGENAVIHEYNSLSTGMMARPKNLVKKLFNAQPAARVFLNRAVRSQFHFEDDVPYAMRDMGIDQIFFDHAAVAQTDKEYDFVYAGSLTDRGAVVGQALEYFRSSFKDASLLVIGDVPGDVYEHFSDCSRMTFTGRIPYEHVAKMASKARYGLNLMPDIYPLNTQTATKVIEYCALGLPIVTSDYKWSRRFEKDRGGRFFFLKPDFSNLTMTEIEAFDFHTPSVQHLEWNRLIRNSGVFDLVTES